MKQIALLALGLLATLGVEAQTYKFDFTTGKKTKDGYTKITPADRYSEEKGYGYDRQPSPEGKSTAPFFFSVKTLYICDQQAQHTYFGKRKCAHQTA